MMSGQKLTRVKCACVDVCVHVRTYASKGTEDILTRFNIEYVGITGTDRRSLPRREG